MSTDPKYERKKILAQLGKAVACPQHRSKIGVFSTFIPFFGDEKTGFEIYKPDIRIPDTILPYWVRKPEKKIPQLAKYYFILSKDFFAGFAHRAI